MFESLAKAYLERRGYLVLVNRVPMLVLSGAYAAGGKGKDKLLWQVVFNSKPYIVALNGTVVT